MDWRDKFLTTYGSSRFARNIPKTPQEAYQLALEWFKNAGYNLGESITKATCSNKSEFMQQIGRVLVPEIRTSRGGFIYDVICDKAAGVSLHSDMDDIIEKFVNAGLVKADRIKKMHETAQFTNNMYDNLIANGYLPSFNELAVQKMGENDPKLFVEFNKAEGGYADQRYWPVFKQYVEKLGQYYNNQQEKAAIYQFWNVFKEKPDLFMPLDLKSLVRLIQENTYNEYYDHSGYEGQPNFQPTSNFYYLDELYKMFHSQIRADIEQAHQVAMQNPADPENQKFLHLYKMYSDIKFRWIDEDTAKRDHDAIASLVNQIKPFIRGLLGREASGFPLAVVPDKPPMITYLTDEIQLEQEGRKMKHCVAGYAEDCINGSSFIYHYNDGQSEGTIELGSNKQVQQFRGYNNAQMPKETWERVEMWLAGKDPNVEIPEEENSQEVQNGLAG
jgi:hypothetical protein